MKRIDVTDLVEFGNNDDESLPITKCFCGKVFDYWEFYIGIYEDTPDVCPNCGAKFIFRNETTVYQLVDEE